MSNDGGIPPEEVCWLQEFNRSFEPKTKTVFWTLIIGLKICRMLDRGEDAQFPFLIRRIFEEKARQFRQWRDVAMEKATRTGDIGFLVAFESAAEALKKEKDDPKFFFRRLTVHIQALLIYEELWQQDGAPPDDEKVLRRMDELGCFDKARTKSGRQKDKTQQRKRAIRALKSVKKVSANRVP